MKKPFLLIIDGVTGAGKTTVSKLLSQRIPRVAVIGMDKVKKLISDFKRGKRDNAIAKDVVFEMAKKYLEHNISVIVEQTFKSKKELEIYENLAQKHSIPIRKVQLLANPKLAFERVINRQRDWGNKVPEKRVKRNISLFKNKKDKGFIVINTSKVSGNKVAEKIFKLLGK